jgi:hypothetical protein
MTFAWASALLLPIMLLQGAAGAAELDCAMINRTAPEVLNKQGSDADLMANFCRASEQAVQAMIRGNEQQRIACTETVGGYVTEMRRRSGKTPDINALINRCPKTSP